MPFPASTLPRAGGSGLAADISMPQRLLVNRTALTVLVLTSILAVPVSAGEPIKSTAYWASRDVVNPVHDNIFLHVSPEVGHSLIISLVYFSFWLGALGWDIFSTLQFDLRLVRETKWQNPLSVINSLAYVLSRYFTFAWILKCVLDGFTASADCRIRLVQSASLYGVAVCSTYLVFLLRTMNMWKSKMWVCIPLVLCFFAMIALCAALPQNMTVERLPGDPFCNYQLGGWLSYAVLTACALFDLLNFGLLGFKLSRSGIKGILRCLLPKTEANYDHEDVTQMLLQKTGIFTAVQFLLLISIAVVYGTLPQLNYQLMQVACFHSISASMAGRIFRRAWRLSREQSASNINQPPGYQLSWAERAGLGGNGTQGMGGIDGIPVSKKKEQNLLRDDDSYVEGEFKLTSKEKEKVSSILPRTRPDIASNAITASLPHTGTSIQSTERRQSAPDAQALAEEIPMDHRAIINMEPAGRGPPGLYPPPSASIKTDTRSIGPSGTDCTADAITFVDATPSYESSRDASPSRAAGPSSQKGSLGLRMGGRGRRASTSAGPARSRTADRGRRPQTTGSTASSIIQIISPTGELSPPTAFSPPSQHRSRSGTDASEPGIGSSPSWQSIGFQTPSDSPHSREFGVDQRASLAKHAVAERPKSSGSIVSKPTTPKDTRPAFVASPAMATGGSSSLAGSAGHAVIDFNAAKAASSTLSSLTGSTTSTQDTIQALPFRSYGTRGQGSARPSTAPHEQQGDSARAGPSSPRMTAEDPLTSFWSTVQADEERHGREGTAVHDSAVAEDGRPRTSRGGAIAPFGHREQPRASFGRRQSVPYGRDDHPQTSKSGARPGTSHGESDPSSTGSFGRLRSQSNSNPATSSGALGAAMLSQDASTIDETYRELERMANSSSVSSLRQDGDIPGRSSMSSSVG